MKRPQLYTRPMLTPEHFTAKNGLHSLTSGGLGVSGLCTPDHPWGEQCTRLLEDGTPVDFMGFPRAVLAHLAGDPDARQDYLDLWEERVTKICGSA